MVEEIQKENKKLEEQNGNLIRNQAELEELVDDLGRRVDGETGGLTTAESDRAIDRMAPPDGVRLREFVDRCRHPFPIEQVGVLLRSSCRDCKAAGRWEACKKHQWIRSGKCDVPNCAGNHESSAVHLDYVGHAEITARLLELDPLWDWEPVAWDPEGKPVITKRETIASMWIRLTIQGVTRLGVGTCSTSKEDVEKELIGDALRNAAMRFGIGLDLWSKSENLDGSFDREPVLDKAPATTAGGEGQGDVNGAPEPSDAAGGQSEAVNGNPEKPKQPSGSGPDRETVMNAFLRLRGQAAKDARTLLEDEGLWPVLDVPDDRLDVVAGLIGPLLKMQDPF